MSGDRISRHRRRAAQRASPAVHQFRRVHVLAALAVIAALTGATCSCGGKRPGPPRPYMAFVASEASGTLAVVNLASFQVTDSIPVAPTPIEVTARPGARELYVLSRSGVITIIPFPELRPAATLRVGSRAGHLVFTSGGKLAAAADNAVREIVLIDCASRSIAGRIKMNGQISALSFTPNGETLVAADSENNRLIFIDAANKNLLGSVQVGKQPGSLVMLPDGSKLFVADTGEPMISTVDIGSRQVLSNIELGSVPDDLVLKPDGGELFALSRHAATISILDTFHDDVETEMPAAKCPVAAVPTRDSTQLYVASAAGAPACGQDGGTVEQIDVQNRKVLASTFAGTSLSAMALTPDERFLVVTDSAGSSVAVLETSPLSTKAKVPSVPLPLVTTVSVGAQPVSVAIPDWLSR